MVSCSRSIAEHVDSMVVEQCRMRCSRCRNDDSALQASADVKQNAPDSLLLCFSFSPLCDRRFGTSSHDESVLLTALKTAAEETMFT